MRANNRWAAEYFSEKRRRRLAAGILRPTPQLVSSIPKAAQRRSGATPDPLAPARSRISVIVSRPIRLSERGEPIRHVLIFDDHPATIRLLRDVDLGQKRTNKLALVEFGALIVLLMLALFWPLLS